MTGIVLITMALFGGRQNPVNEVSHGSRELSQTSGPVTAREALGLVYPIVEETSTKPVLVLITSGADINAEGRSSGWELVFHFPKRSAQAVYSLESSDPERSDAALRLKWRLSPRRHVRGEDTGLPLQFTDSPEAVQQLSRIGVDWIAGDPDMTLSTKRLPSGEAVWAVESYGKELTTPFVTPSP